MMVSTGWHRITYQSSCWVWGRYPQGQGSPSPQLDPTPKTKLLELLESAGCFRSNSHRPDSFELIAHYTFIWRHQRRRSLLLSLRRLYLAGNILLQFLKLHSTSQLHPRQTPTSFLNRHFWSNISSRLVSTCVFKCLVSSRLGLGTSTSRLVHQCTVV